MNNKYIQKTPSGKFRVCFPRNIKWPRGLGTFNTIEIAQKERDDYLASKGIELDGDTVSELSTVDKTPVVDAKGKCIVGLYDMHFPYQHDGALSIAKQIISDLQPDTIIFGGDCVDFFQLSTFLKDASRASTIQDELDAWYNGAKEILSVCENAQVFHLVGNHELRLYRYLCANSELSSLRALQLHSLLRLDDLRAQQAKALRFLDKSLVMIHGRYASTIAGTAVKKEMKARGWQQSVIMGHGHRTGSFEVAGPLSRIEGHEVGCLCQDSWYSQDEIVWQRGFCVVTIGDGFSVENIHIDNETIYRGSVYRE